VLSVELACALRDAGLRWKPARGDRFAVREPEMASETFVLSDMTIEVQNLPNGDRVIGFNGTTEWALDSVDQSKTVWIPRETQIRELLGRTFRGLTRRDDGQWTVAIVVNSQPMVFADDDPEVAYAEALLHLIRRGLD
jgi:hypothetical protein